MKRFRKQHSKNCPEKRNLAMITNGKDHTYCLRSLDRFSCGIILCCVAAIALAGCPEYKYAPPWRICPSGATDPGTPQGSCEWTGPKSCEGCEVKLVVFGKYYPCREGGENGTVVDGKNCSGENPLKCTGVGYNSDVDCDHYSWDEDTCVSRGCHYQYSGTLD